MQVPVLAVLPSEAPLRAAAAAYLAGADHRDAGRTTRQKMIAPTVVITATSSAQRIAVENVTTRSGARTGLETGVRAGAAVGGATIAGGDAAITSNV